MIKLKDFEEAYEIVKSFVRVTDLVEYSDPNVFLKKESEQMTNSFKWSGVLFATMKIFDSVLDEARKTTKCESSLEPYYIVTQSTGNHGIATIVAINVCVQKYSSEYPEYIDIWNNIIGIIFISYNILPVKLREMLRLQENYKNIIIDQESLDYKDAVEKRNAFLEEHKGIYLEHGGKSIMTGYGSISIQIREKLEDDVKKIAFVCAVGAGGPVGIGMCLSYFYETHMFIVQTDDCDAFIRYLKTKEKVKNTEKPNIVSNGIAVDEPESFALSICDKVVDNLYFTGIRVDHKKVFDKYKEEKEKLSYSTCISLTGLESIDLSAYDTVIVLDCELSK